VRSRPAAAPANGDFVSGFLRSASSEFVGDDFSIANDGQRSQRCSTSLSVWLEKKTVVPSRACSRRHRRAHPASADRRSGGFIKDDSFGDGQRQDQSELLPHGATWFDLTPRSREKSISNLIAAVHEIASARQAENPSALNPVIHDKAAGRRGVTDINFDARAVAPAIASKMRADPDVVAKIRAARGSSWSFLGRWPRSRRATLAEPHRLTFSIPRREPYRRGGFSRDVTSSDPGRSAA